VPEAPGEVHPAHAVAAPGAPSGGTEVLPDFRAGATARRVGTLVHRLLRVVAVQGPAAWDDTAIEGRRDWIAAELTALGVADAELDAATERVGQALRTTLADARGRWLLDPGHAEAACEQPVSGEVDGALVNGVIDRTFVDGEGTRWIVDYKTGYHEGGDPEAFLDEEQARYADQLAGYAALCRALEARPVTLALYFPLLGEWRVWEPS
jgi:ATP-dependent exoDNAse (exonuclease V) beta subunit